MEILLQWLDELDDLVFAGFRFWPRLRRFCLGVAACAALALVVHFVSLGDLDPDLALALLGVSLGALTTWMLFALISRSTAASRHSMSTGA